MAQGLTSLTAAKCAVAVHGLAGEILEVEIGTVGVTAQDIIGTVRSLIN
jgi:NAD(P)H-hydrate repair Nnr-like enzyme with NAD(P)H-hydrate dehydratase domain